MIAFINKAIPYFQKRTRSRDNFIVNIKQQEFLNGTTIFKECDDAKSCFIIKEGEVKLVKDKSTIDYLAKKQKSPIKTDTSL